MDVEKQVLKLAGIKEFNPMQRSALKKDWKNKSIVVSAPTASGKTLLAELASMNSVVNKRRKVIYTCPLRALATEHWSEFRRKYSKELGIRVALSTGDLDGSSSYLQNYDIIFTTYEKLDSLLRHRSDWLASVGLLVIDEVHSLGTDRGPTIEMAVTKLRGMNASLQVLALSATIPNNREISEWLGAELVESNYRPIPLREGIFFDGKVEYNKGKAEKLDLKEPLKALVKDTVFKKEKQALIFANTRRRAEGIASQLASFVEKSLSDKQKTALEKDSKAVLKVLDPSTEQCKRLSNLVSKGVAFHHAGLLSKQRTVIEDAFRSNNLKLIAATPTLAAGINLPSHTVIIPSLYRYTAVGMARISVSEYKQMCLPFEAKLLTKEFGFLEIGKIVEEKRGCSVLSFNLVSSKAEFKPVKNFFSRKAPQVLKLDLNTGNCLRLTPNHELLIFENGDFSWKKASALSVGDSLIQQSAVLNFNMKMPFFFELLPVEETFVVGCGDLFSQAKEKLNITERALAKMLGINHKRIYHIKKNKKAMPLKLFLSLSELLGFSKVKRAELIKKVKTAYGNMVSLPKVITSDFLWLAGFIATDGNLNCCTDKRTGSQYVNIRVFNKNRKIINKFREILLSLGLTSTMSVRPDGLITLEVGSTLLAKVLSNHFGINFGNKTSKVTIPNILLNSKPRLIGAYLGGVFDGDGNFNKAKQKRGLNSNVYRILFVTGSKKFAFGIQSLLFRLGIVSSIKKQYNNQVQEIKGKKAFFNKPTYYVIFRKIAYIKKFVKYAGIYKQKIKVEYSTYRNVNKRDSSLKQFETVKITNIKRSKFAKAVYNIQVKDNENYFADNILVHNCGRAGRPQYDVAGRGILVARAEVEKEELMELYINGKVEPAESKLGAEPVLRMHMLALIASGFVFDLASMEEFFKKTFYALQYGEMQALFEKLQSVLEQLQEMDFIESNNKRIDATPLGKRVSELYLDPLSAFEMIKALKKHPKFSQLSYLFLLSNCSELMPWLSVPKVREAGLWEQIQLRKNELPIDVDKEMFFDLNLLRKFNTSLMLEQWVEEAREQILMDDFKTQPGILHAKIRICDWLCYSASELARLLKLERHFSPLGKMRKRLKHGVKEELVFLTEVKYIGRARARRLWRGNIRSIAELKKVDEKDLARILGEGVAKNIKAALGQK